MLTQLPARRTPALAAVSADAEIVGSGPNGLAAAITLARAGHRVTVYEAGDTPGGGCRSAEVTLPGFIHDICSAIHPLGVASPLFRGLPLAHYGLDWIFPPAPAAHPLDDGTAVVLHRSVEETAAQLGQDGAVYRRLMGPLAAHWSATLETFLAPLRVPRHPIGMMTLGIPALLPAVHLARVLFHGERARALFGGLSAHSMMPLGWPATSAFGLMLGMLAHGAGWPMARGGSGSLTHALVSYLASLGGSVVRGRRIESIDELSATTVLLDVGPWQVASLAGDRLPADYRGRLARYRYGPGVFKIDYALDAPVPWRAKECLLAGTLHLGGSLEEISASEAAVTRGEIPQRPYVLFAQQTLFDPSRAPAGKHTAWAYCHTPNGSTADMTDFMEAQIERFAPGFRSRILARVTRNAAEMEAYNPNYVGGDINGGLQDLRQLWSRPVQALDPYATPASGLYICSASTPPGGGVHGMCGYWAARSALKHGRPASPFGGD